ncbi:methylated-DNA--[protein]-cysteine S-methyltransferase [sulfur-oxidizing endosymbiont of Gigantopelta aegis]|uniref:methylated-DNA--[protein]-cysteine S-methyltransferase n=1 Tax=sulfur-oxidizing endosymbiont of Gigantopelta aegis TaxID=2794934 RepID=UPI001FEB567C|nr:methylated-DNA--[protein]-cysteine S-methyltransferase [sulfur-oxidizing endosymbiont of Gigantopelta aegis]
MNTARIMIPLHEYEQFDLVDVHLCVRFKQTMITGISYEKAEGIDFLSKQIALLRDVIEQQFAKKIIAQVDSYFHQANFQFTIACNIYQGTVFQQRVWQALRKIPSGVVKTYGELAKELNTSARAIGNACRNNHFPFVIPCHRIVSASGVGGYAGDTLALQKGKINFMKIKQSLLAHEACFKNKAE